MTDQALAQLTPREFEILRLLCTGIVTNRDLAQHLIVSPFTVECHMKQIMAKLEVTTRAGVIVRAYQGGLLGDVA